MNETLDLNRFHDINDLRLVMKALRDKENGCPWDSVQTHESIRQDCLEEAYEVCDAIDRNDMADLREELGDLLLQVVFHSAMEEEKGNFTFDDVCDAVATKMIQRHPHDCGCGGRRGSYASFCVETEQDGKEGRKGRI